MLKTSRTLIAALFTAALTLTGCAAQDTAQSQRAVACYNTGVGTKCVETFSDILSESDDVDGDGQEDGLVCGDAPSESDSDGDQTSDSDTDSEEELATEGFSPTTEGDGDETDGDETDGGETDGDETDGGEELDCDSSGPGSGDDCETEGDGDGDDYESDSDGDADSESESDEQSESDTDCGESDADDASSESESDAEGDGDGDGIVDAYDCDCVDEQNPPAETPVPTDPIIIE